MRVVTIIPGRKTQPDGPHSVQGTQVLLSDGTRLQRVTAITIRGEVGCVWVASIDVLLDKAPEIAAETECTSVSDDSRKYE